jgi:hypothetical protein
MPSWPGLRRLIPEAPNFELIRVAAQRKRGRVGGDQSDRAMAVFDDQG